jgi:hypothetical protein
MPMPITLPPAGLLCGLTPALCEDAVIVRASGNVARRAICGNPRETTGRDR